MGAKSKLRITALRLTESLRHLLRTVVGGRQLPMKMILNIVIPVIFGEMQGLWTRSGTIRRVQFTLVRGFSLLLTWATGVPWRSESR
jgi:hypothetical protein